MGCQMNSRRITVRRPQWYTLMLFVWAAFSGTANAQLEVLITDIGNVRPYPIAARK